MDHETAKTISARALAAMLPELTRLLEASSRASEVEPEAAHSPEPGEQVRTAIKRRAANRPAAREALEDLENDPADPDLQAGFRAQLRKLLLEEEDFASELQGLLDKTGEGGKHYTAANRSVAGEQIQGSIFTGDISGSVNLNSPGESDRP